MQESVFGLKVGLDEHIPSRFGIDGVLRLESVFLDIVCGKGLLVIGSLVSMETAKRPALG